MQISVSSTLTVSHDGQFWIGLVEHVEDGKLGVARIVFGAEPSDTEILEFIVNGWEKLSFYGNKEPDKPKVAKNPKRRMRDTSKALKQPAVSTKAQKALAEQRAALKEESAQTRRARREPEKRTRFERRTEKRKRKRRGH